MEEEKYQKELFEFAEPKKPFSKLASLLPKRDFEGKIALSLTLEKIVFIFIGMVMVMVLVFALGVENGKSRGDKAKAAPGAVPSATAPKAQAKARALQIGSAAPAQKSFFDTTPAVAVRPIIAVTVPKAGPKAGASQPDSGAAAKPYTIVAATFSKRETAQAAVAFLTKEGFAATVAFGDPYYRVCVGSYADMYGTQVQRDLAKVRRVYKDAFIRAR